MKKVEMYRVNGVGKANGRIPRFVIERNVLDMLEGNEMYLDLGFCDAQIITEEATVEELFAIYTYKMTTDEFKKVAERILG